jgi:BASS family bile acid:Na+ symporter
MAGTIALIFPKPGSALSVLVTPVLGVMVLNVSMTIRFDDLKQIAEHPFMICWSAFLQFIPMSLFALLLGKMFSQWLDISTGQLLLGALPADVSAPLMVYLAGGSTALGTAMLVVLPSILAWFGGVAFSVPISYLVIELFGIIIAPVVLGIFLNLRSASVRENERIWSGIASVCYIILLLIVVSSNAQKIIALKVFALLMLLIEVILNLFGYSLAFLTKLIFRQQDTFLPMLFVVSSKEFGIASAAVETMRLNTALVIPSVFYAVVQMISAPIMVRIFMKASRQATRQ